MKIFYFWQKLIFSAFIAVFIPASLFSYSSKKLSRDLKLLVQIAKTIDTELESEENTAQESFTNYSWLELPACSGTTEHAHDHQIRVCPGFVLCYRESYEQAEWVAYELTSSELEKKVSRSNNFQPDLQISTGSATWYDYRGSGYDRGHLAPAGDMTWSQESMDSCFLMSNISPQVPAFNQGIWQKLETKVRSWAKRYGSVWVVTGPVLEKPSYEYKQIGSTNSIAVPQFYYKALLAKKKDSSYVSAAFLLPNEASSEPLSFFKISIDELEERTGLDFFPALEDSLEDEIESKIFTNEFN